MDLLNFARPCSKPASPKLGENITLTTQAALFKSEVVKMLVSGQTAAYTSKALGISENLIYRWKNQNRPAARQGVKKATGEQNELVLENQQLKD